MDKDGRSDLVFRSETMLLVLLGAGDGSFLGSLAYECLRGSPMALADFDQNGRVDLGVARTEAQALRWHVYRNDQCR